VQTARVPTAKQTQCPAEKLERKVARKKEREKERERERGKKRQDAARIGRRAFIRYLFAGASKPSAYLIPAGVGTLWTHNCIVGEYRWASISVNLRPPLPLVASPAVS